MLSKIQKKLELQIQLNNKWKKETITITDTFEKLISNLKKELQKLRKNNDELTLKLQKAENKIKEYKIFMELISKDVNTITKTIGQNTNEIR